MTVLSIPEIKQRGYRKVRFQPDNKAYYFMDFSWWIGLPSDRDFYVVHEADDGFFPRKPDEVELVATGYGTKGDYGNGSVYMNKKYLP